MKSHITWYLVVALNVLCPVMGTKGPRQIVYQIRPAPLSAFTSQDGTFLLDDGITEYQFPQFGLKAPERKIINTAAPPPPQIMPVVQSLTSASNDSSDIDSGSSSSSAPSEESSIAVTKEEISEVPRFGTGPVRTKFLTLQPEQIQQIFQQIRPVQQIQQQQVQHVQQQPTPQVVDIGPKYDYKSTEEAASNGEDIKTAQSEVITEDRLQPAYSERREKRKRTKDPPPTPGDASYAFGYETDEAARHEVADPDGNVKGWYTYVDDEGTVRKIIYTAGAGKGFVILGKEKVSSGGRPNNGGGAQRKHKNKGHPQSDYGYSADSSTYSSIRNQKGTSAPNTFSDFNFNSFNDLAKAGTSNPPGPTTIIATAETPARTKKPVFIVKIKRPVQKEQFFTKPLQSPDPLPVPVTPFKSRIRRRPNGMTLSDVVPSLRKSRIKKYPTPPIYYADDEDDQSSYDTSSSAQASGSASSSSEDSESRDESNEPTRGGGRSGQKGEKDSSYVFGYETDTANRLEKSDPNGNVRGSYSYIGSSINQLLNRHSPSKPHYFHYDGSKLVKKGQRASSKRSLKYHADPEGVKRTVHYIAGGNTGFQVIHASPSISRGVRLEAPPGYVVKRVPSLRTSESRYPIPISVPQPSAIVYHIHPDSGWKPWEPTLRKKKIKIHRKKLPKSYFENGERDGIVLLQTHPDPPSSKLGTVSLGMSSMGSNMGGSYGSSMNLGSVGSSSTNTYFKEKVTQAGTGMVTAKETQFPYVPIVAPMSRRRHAPQRGYTAEHHIIQIDDDSKEQNMHHRIYMNSPKHGKSSQQSASGGSSQAEAQAAAQQAVHEREPLLYSPTFEPSRMPIPNPIQLQPTQVAIKNRGAPTSTTVNSQPGLDTSSSNHHPVAFTSDGKLQVDVPTVVIEAIEANSPSSSLVTTQKDEVKNIAPLTVISSIHKLPEPAALTQSAPPPPQAPIRKINNVNNSPNTLIKINPTIRPNYEISSASASSVAYKYHHNQNHHYPQSSVSAPTPPPTPIQSSPPPPPAQKQQAAHPIANQLSGNVPTGPSPPPSRSRRRHHHHRSKVTTIPPPTSPSASSASIITNTVQVGGSSSGNIETTTMMSSSKRLINRLANSEHDATIVV